MTGTPTRRGTAPPGNHPPHAGAPTRHTAAPSGTAAPSAGTPPARRVDEEEIARLAEDAARRAPAVSAPAATVRVDGPAARVDLDVVVDHGVHLPTAADGVRRRAAAGIEARTGLTVEAVTVTVVDLRLPAPVPDDHREAT